MDLSIIIPARNEEWLGHTVDDILSNIEANTEIIVILDGYLPNPPLKADPRVTVIYNPVAVGQRAGANQAAKIAKGKYIMKVDAHCAFDKGFDRKMLTAFAELGDDVTMIPLMRNLHVFNLVCANGHERYQSPSGPCEVCGLPTEKKVVWIPKKSPQTFTFRFDKTMHFQYFSELAKRADNIKGAQKLDGTFDTNYRETMSIQGSCFMLTKQKYFELDICSEEFHSWGQQGVEVACKTWLSGGRVIANLNTWYAHMFRTRGGDFGFPYSNPQDKVMENREKSRELFQKDKWPLATRKMSWLLDKFNPPEWGITKGIIYYTDSQLDEKIAKPVRDKLLQISEEKRIPIVSSSIKKLNFGSKNIFFPHGKRGYLTMFKQIMAALENSKSDIIFFCEHDVLYSGTHFDFSPPKEDVFYYNQNVWLLRSTDGHVLHYDVNQLSGLCVYRDAALTHFRERYKVTEEAAKTMDDREFNNWVRNMGFEPFTHGRFPWVNQFKYETWKSETPNVDIKHGANATGQRWRKDQYKNQQLLINWQEAEDYQVPGWDKADLLPFT
jgi:glycosyltransferase involved in cell wall biosynthesis